MTDLVSLPLYDAITACRACKIREEARRPLPPEGWSQTTTLVVGQNPGHDEDRAGRIFIGRSGEELDEWLRVLRVDRKKLAVMNIVQCHTLKNRAPRVAETRVCAEQWMPQVLEALPNLRVILPLGRPAQTVVVPKTTVPLLEMVAVRVAYGDREYQVYPLAHPAYILRSPGERPRQKLVLAAVRDHWARHCPEAYDAVRT